jgi:hypothetical protein
MTSSFEKPSTLLAYTFTDVRALRLTAVPVWRRATVLEEANAVAIVGSRDAKFDENGSDAGQQKAKFMK